MKILFNRVVLLIVITFSACGGNDKQTLMVKGTVKNLDKTIAMYPDAFRNGSLRLYLHEVPFGKDLQPILLDSVLVTAKENSFILKGKTKGTGIYDIMIENGPIIPLVNDVNEIILDIDMSDKDKYYMVNGSDASKQLRDFIFTYSEKRTLVNKYLDSLDDLKRFNAPDSVIIDATNRKNTALADLNTYIKNFLNSTNQSAVSAFALTFASNTFIEAEFESELNKQVKKYPAENSLSYLKQEFDTRRTALTEQKSREAEAEKKRSPSLWVGKKVPELVLPDVTGKNISLSSFHGKYVLIDFWASWCGPCRRENPNVVNAYNRFKNKNFTILGVSLDKEKSNWLQAIKDDNLTWPHVSDLGFWESKAVTTFGFDGIPFNVLVDPDGTVIGEGLRGDDLVKKLEEVLK